MFIQDTSSLSPDKKIIVSRRMGEYLINKYHIPVLSICLDDYIFANTEELQTALSQLPWYVKLFY